MNNQTVSKINDLCCEYRRCKQCSRGELDTWAWPRGNPNSKGMIIGRDPGKVEVETRCFFVGPAGQLMDELFHCAGLSTDDFYITNVVKCQRPSEKGSGKQNTEPTPEEINACRYLLNAEMLIVNPTIVLLMGKLAAEVMLGRQIKMRNDVGKLITCALGGTSIRTFIPMYHPAYIVRNPTEELKREFIQHLGAAKKIMEK